MNKFLVNGLCLAAGIVATAGYFTSASRHEVRTPASQQAAALPLASPSGPPKTSRESIAPPVSSNRQDDVPPVEAKAAPASEPIVASATPDTRVTDDNARRLAAAKAKVERQYGAFLASWTQSGGDSDKFRDKLVERQMITSDILTAGRAQGIDLTDPVASKPLLELVRKSTAEFNLQMKADVGEPAYKAWVASEIIKPDLNVTNELNRRLAGISAELTPEQLTLVMTTLHDAKDASGRRNSIVLTDADGGPLPVRLIEESAIEKIRPVLSAPQIAKLVEIYQEQKSGPANIKMGSGH